ncbi:hypothetical protein CYMTET_47383 [Cymbomonas tetramitiformis]|uniref:Uncharacterized protein n=1 Tax=Cymbomonas tetramitiformis TaxID=36881 RepID=A0AAE0BW52_9CHLO|nr:hypothetical protein CYMTET_47383 [Cymbomonas tetramitiformis]
MALRAQKQSLAPLEGKWVADSPASLYRKWVGTGFPCTVCFRLWNVTDAHPDTRGACPWWTRRPHLLRERRLRLTELAPGGGGAIDPVDSGALVVSAENADTSPPPDGPEEPACYGATFPDEDDTWPAFRSSPIWLPNSAVTGDVEGNLPEP